MRIGLPEAAEIHRLIDHQRICQQLAVDWKQRPWLERQLLREPISLKQWKLYLEADYTQHHGGLNLSLLQHLQREGVLALHASGDARSAWEKLDDLTGLQSVKAHLKQLVTRHQLLEQRR